MAAPAYTQRRSLSFKDARGHRGRMSFVVGAADANGADAAMLALKVAAQAASNAHVTEPTDVARDNQYGVAAQYQSVEDKAMLFFQNGEGRISRYQLPAPLASVFLTDGETVNVTGGAAGLITAIETSVVADYRDTSGLAYVGGYRIRRAIQRKTNVWTVNPAETGPDE